MTAREKKDTISQFWSVSFQLFTVSIFDLMATNDFITLYSEYIFYCGGLARLFFFRAGLLLSEDSVVRKQQQSTARTGTDNDVNE